MIKLAVIFGCLTGDYGTSGNTVRIVNAETGERLADILSARWIYEGGNPPLLELQVVGAVSWSVAEWEARLAEQRARKDLAAQAVVRRVVAEEDEDDGPGACAGSG